MLSKTNCHIVQLTSHVNKKNFFLFLLILTFPPRPSIIDGYKLKDIYKCDKTGLFYYDKTLAIKGHEYRGEKRSKERVTALLCCNATGAHLCKQLVIGKAVKPRCSKNIDINQLLVKWSYNWKV